MKLRNIRFARGSDEVIGQDDFRAEICSAVSQRENGTAVLMGWPKTKREKVDAHTFVANI